MKDKDSLEIGSTVMLMDINSIQYDQWVVTKKNRYTAELTRKDSTKSPQVRLVPYRSLSLVGKGVRDYE